MKKSVQIWLCSWFWRVTMWYDLWERRPMHRTICLCGWQSGQLSGGNKIWLEPNLKEFFTNSFLKLLIADGEDGGVGDDHGTMVFRMTIRMRVMMTIDTIFVDNQGWGGASSLPVSVSSPLFPSSIVWWAPFVFQLFYEVWYCSSYCLYPCVNSLSDPCPIIVLQFVQSLSQSDSICFPKQLKVCKKYQSWNMEWGVRWNWSLNKSC